MHSRSLGCICNKSAPALWGYVFLLSVMAPAVLPRNFPPHQHCVSSKCYSSAFQNLSKFWGLYMGPLSLWRKGTGCVSFLNYPYTSRVTKSKDEYRQAGPIMREPQSLKSNGRNVPFAPHHHYLPSGLLAKFFSVQRQIASLFSEHTSVGLYLVRRRRIYTPSFTQESQSGL